MKRTDWFPRTVRPVHIGVYEVTHPIFDDVVFYQHWDGKHWGFIRTSMAGAYESRNNYSKIQPTPRWRGLAQKPK